MLPRRRHSGERFRGDAPAIARLGGEACVASNVSAETPATPSLGGDAMPALHRTFPRRRTRHSAFKAEKPALHRRFPRRRTRHSAFGRSSPRCIDGFRGDAPATARLGGDAPATARLSGDAPATARLGGDAMPALHRTFPRRRTRHSAFKAETRCPRCIERFRGDALGTARLRAEKPALHRTFPRRLTRHSAFKAETRCPRCIERFRGDAPGRRLGGDPML